MLQAVTSSFILRRNIIYRHILPFSRHVSTASVVAPQSLPRDHINTFSPIDEASLIWKSKGKPDEDLLTRVDLRMLKYAAAHAFSTTEEPMVVYGGGGGFNSLFILEFQSTRKKLLARVALNRARTPSRIQQAVATMSFVHHVRGIPTPKVYAWNAASDNPVKAPYILQEWFEDDDVIEPWKVYKRVTDGQRAVILDDLARWHAALLDPLPPPLSGVGDLVFAPGISRDADLSDPRNYVVQPLHRRVWRPPETPDVAFKGSTTSLPAIWGEMLDHRHSLALPSVSSGIDRRELWLNRMSATREDRACDVRSFTTVASHVRRIVDDALAHLRSSAPDFSAPCLVRADYAFRNILLHPSTLRVKAFIDWDDVHVMPFALALNYPEDITWFSPEGLDPGATWYREGCFGPPDEYGDVVGPLDADGNSMYEDENGKSNGLEDRDVRILNTMRREAYISALQKYDRRVGFEGLRELRERMVRADSLLAEGGYRWWDNRAWLTAEAMRLEKLVVHQDEIHVA